MKASLAYKNRWSDTGRSWFVFEADLPGYEFEREIKNESVLVNGEIVKREFLEKNTNLISSAELKWVYGWRPLNYSLGFGGEVGKSTSRTVKQDSNGEEVTSVFRPKAEVAVAKVWKADHDHPVSFDGSYTLRWPLEPEPFQRAGYNDDQPALSRLPRYWASVDLGFQLTTGIKIEAQYRYGSLPPSFEFVDHQVTLGIAILLRAPKAKD